MPSTPDDRKRRAADEPLADAEILRRLEAEGFDPNGAAWAEFSPRLVEYGYGVFVGWLMGGNVYRMAAQRRIRGLARIPRGLKLDRDDAHEVAVALLEVAPARFLATLRAGQWRPSGGASLLTFYIGRCLMQFPDVYERWNRERELWSRLTRELVDVEGGRMSVDPAELALDAIRIDELLPFPGFEHVRVMLLLADAGYTYREISEEFTRSGIPYTEATVRTRIMRARVRARARRRDERGDSDGR